MLVVSHRRPQFIDSSVLMTAAMSVPAPIAAAESVKASIPPMTASARRW
jgi:hypothetical protein